MAQTAKPARQRRKHYIKAWRAHRGITQEQIAERLAMSRENYSKIENGSIDYTQRTLEAIALALSCTPGDLLMRDPATSAPPLDGLLEGVDPEKLPRIIEVIEALKKAL